MGRKVTLLRKKQDSKCFNRQGWENLINSRNCECSYDDYHCTMGFRRTENGLCEIDYSRFNNFSLLQEKYCVNGYYDNRRGYKKIVSNGCKGELEPRYHMKVKCDN